MYQESFSQPVEVTGSMYFRNIFQIMCILQICTKTWKEVEFLSFTEVCANKNIEIMKLWVQRFE